MIEDIKKNIDSEMRMLREISIYMNRFENASVSERDLLLNAVNSLIESMKIVNDTIPGLVVEIRDVNLENIPKTRKNEDIEKVSFGYDKQQLMMTIPSRKKEELLKELSISRSYIKKIKRGKSDKKEALVEFKATRGYLKVANSLFWNNAVKAIRKGYFKKLARELQRANIDILFQSYVAMIFMTLILSTIFSIFISLFLLFFDVNMGAPFITFYSGDYLIRLSQVVGIILLVPLVVFLVLYYYPSGERKSLEKRINQELPFAVIHMSAISGSGIQPSEIFRIIGLSKEYLYLRKEIR